MLQVKKKRDSELLWLVFGDFSKIRSGKHIDSNRRVWLFSVVSLPDEMADLKECMCQRFEVSNTSRSFSFSLFFPWDNLACATTAQREQGRQCDRMKPADAWSASGPWGTQAVQTVATVCRQARHNPPLGITHTAAHLAVEPATLLLFPLTIDRTSTT